MFPQREEGEGRSDGDIYGSLFGLSVVSLEQGEKTEMKFIFHYLLNAAVIFRHPVRLQKWAAKITVHTTFTNFFCLLGPS